MEPLPQSSLRIDNSLDLRKNIVTIFSIILSFVLGSGITYVVITRSTNSLKTTETETAKANTATSNSEDPDEIVSFQKNIFDSLSFTYLRKFGTPKIVLLNCKSEFATQAEEACYFTTTFSGSPLVISGYDDQKIKKDGGITNTMSRFEYSFMGGDAKSGLKRLCAKSNVFDCSVIGGSHWRLLVAPDGLFEQETKLGGEEYEWTRLEVDYNAQRKFRVIIASYPLDNCPWELDLDDIKHVASDIIKGLPMCKTKAQVDYDQTLKSIQAFNRDVLVR